MFFLQNLMKWIQVEYNEEEYEDYGGYDGGSGYGNNMAQASATDKGEQVLTRIFYDVDFR